MNNSIRFSQTYPAVMFSKTVARPTALNQMTSLDRVSFSRPSLRFGNNQPQAQTTEKKEWPVSKHVCIWGGLGLAALSVAVGVATLGLTAPAAIAGMGIGGILFLIGLFIKSQPVAPAKTEAKPGIEGTLAYSNERKIITHDVGHALVAHIVGLPQQHALGIRNEANAEGAILPLPTISKDIVPATAKQDLNQYRLDAFKRMVTAFAGVMANRVYFPSATLESDADIAEGKPAQMADDFKYITRCYKHLLIGDEKYGICLPDYSELPKKEVLYQNAVKAARAILEAVPKETAAKLIGEIETKKSVEKADVAKLLDSHLTADIRKNQTEALEKEAKFLVIS